MLFEGNLKHESASEQHSLHHRSQGTKCKRKTTGKIMWVCEVTSAQNIMNLVYGYKKKTHVFPFKNWIIFIFPLHKWTSTLKWLSIVIIVTRLYEIIMCMSLWWTTYLWGSKSAERLLSLASCSTCWHATAQSDFHQTFNNKLFLASPFPPKWFTQIWGRQNVP